MQIENRDAYKKVSIYELGLSTRTLNTLMRANYTTLYQLIANAENLGTIKNMGINCLVKGKTKFCQAYKEHLKR